MAKVQLNALIENIALNIKKEYEMCQEMSFFNFGDGKPTPELRFLPGRLRWALLPKSAAVIHSAVADRTPKPPIERRTSHRRPKEMLVANA